MRTRFLIVVGFVLLSGAAPCHAASATLSVSGAANTGLDWRVTAPVVLDSSIPTVDSASALFGLAIENLDTHTVLAMFYDGSELRSDCRYPQDVLPPCHSTAPVTSNLGLHLAPGNYRVRLFGEGSGTISMPITSGLPTTSFTTNEPTDPATIELRDPRLLAPVGVGRDTMEFDYRKGASVSYLVQETARNQFVGPGDTQVCLRDVSPTGQCIFGTYSGAGAPQTVADGDGWLRIVAFDDPINMTPGRYVGEVDTASASAVDQFTELLVIVDPSP